METIETRILDMLVRWDELRRSGELVSAETLCEESPELQDEFMRRIAALKAMEPLLTDEPPSLAGALRPESNADGIPYPADLANQGPPGYEIYDVLGHGSMGIVYRALDRARGEAIALKTVLRLEPAALYRFKREFRALADLTHPNLVKLYELVCTGREWWIAMELIEGVDFLSYVRPVGAKQLPGRLADAFRQFATGVAALHAADRLHRDLKPSNVRVTNSGRVVILDFGLAAELDSDGRQRRSEHHAVGTVAYMAPEQADGQRVGPEADWYSFGVMLYEAITGWLPIRGTREQIVANKLRGKLTPLPMGLPGVTDHIATLCTSLLERDPAARPSGDEILCRLSAEARSSSVIEVPRGSRPEPTKLAGRGRHLHALREALAAVERGQAVTLFVQGRSGAGKTTLVQRFLDSLSESAATVVLSGRCREQEWVPFKAVDGLIDALSRHLNLLPVSDARELLPRDVRSLVRVFPVLGRVEAVAGAPGRAAEVSDPRMLRTRAFTALRELLGRIGDRGRLLLFVDDLQWGDNDSAAILSEVLRPPDQPVLLFLGSYRSEDGTSSPVLQTLLELMRGVSGAEYRELEVEPLSPAEAEDLAIELLGHEAPGAVEYAKTIAQESQGSPFFVHELVQQARRADRAPAPGGILNEVLWSRIEKLPDEARRLLEVVAVSGRPLRSADAARVAGLEAGERTALLTLRSDRLVRSAGPQENGQIEVYHDRIREVVMDHLAPEVLKDCHLRLALWLGESDDADVEVLAVHFHQAGETDLARANYAAAAERASASLAFDRAATLYRLALELGARNSPDEYGLRARLGDALANARRGRDAGQVYLDASPGVSRVESIDLRRRAFQQLLTAGHLEQGLEVLREVFRDVRLCYPKTESRALTMAAVDAARLWCRGLRFSRRSREAIDDEEILRLDVGWSAGMGLSLIDTARAARIFLDNLLRSLRSGSEFHVTQAMLAVSGLMAVSGRAGLSFSHRLMQSAERSVNHVEDPTLVALHFMAKGLVAHCQGHWSDSLEFNDRGAAVFREQCTGVATSLDISAYFSLLALFWLGEFSELRRRRQALLEEAQERQDLFSMTNYRTEVMAYDLLAAGESTRATLELDDAIRQWSPRGFHVQHLFALFASVRIDLYHGAGRDARGRLAAARQAYWRSGLNKSCIARINYEQLVACSALSSLASEDGVSGPLREASAAMVRLERERLPYARALATMIRGRIAAIRDDEKKAATCYRHAVDAFRALRMPLYEAATVLRLSELLIVEESTDLNRQAIAWFASQQIQDPISMARMILP